MRSRNAGKICDCLWYLGWEVEGYICQSIAAARENRAQIEALYRRTGSIDEIVTELVEEIYR
jgi:hypothetical protein